MSPHCLASSRLFRTAPVLVGLVSVAIPARPCHANGPAKLLVFAPDAPADPARWRERLARAYGALELDPDVWLRSAQPQRGIEPSRLAALARIDQQLARAQGRAAAFAEDEALAELAQAADLGEQLADVPGAAAWNAEIQLRLALIAAQAGQDGVAESAFRRAATLDPARRLLDAEAAPEVVARGVRVQRETALGARGEFDVRVLAADARVYLDDVALGRAPAHVRAPVGRHVLRVEAPGRVSYGAFIDVLEGARPALVVEPVPSPELERARALARAARRGNYAQVAEGLAAPDAPSDVLVLETARTSQRALLVACDAHGCRRPLRIAGAALPSALPLPALDSDSLARDRSWLGAAPAATDAASTPWWQRWYVWAPLAAAAAGATALALASEPAPAQHLRVVVEPGNLGR